MAIEIYDISVAATKSALQSLKHILTKGETYAAAKKFDPSVLAQTRLFPDMIPLAGQVRIACDISKFGAARLSMTEAPKFEDDETTIAQLIQRVQMTLDYLNGMDRSKFTGAETREVIIKTPVRELRFDDGLSYVMRFVLPNVHFHCSMTYALLRHNGVELGKADYLGDV